MALCGITHEAPGSCQTPATRAQMAAKQANYFNTELWCPTQMLRGLFGILHFSLQRCSNRSLSWSCKAVTWIVVVIKRPQCSAWCPDAKLVICSVFLRKQRHLVEQGGALSLPLVLIDVDILSLLYRGLSMFYCSLSWITMKKRFCFNLYKISS